MPQDILFFRITWLHIGCYIFNEKKNTLEKNFKPLCKHVTLNKKSLRACLYLAPVRNYGHDIKLYCIHTA